MNVDTKFIKGISNAYLVAKEIVIQKGYHEEILEQSWAQYTPLTEKFLLSEAAWVILSAGMKETVIRSVFPAISKIFFNWNSASRVELEQAKCRKLALAEFNNHKKIDAIIYLTTHVARNSFEDIRNSIHEGGIDYLRQFPFMGPATAYHLAKNIGLQVVKPDRHLVRIAEKFNFNSPHELCNAISEYVGDDLPEIDLVLWRYATIERNYIDYLYNASLETIN